MLRPDAVRSMRRGQTSWGRLEMDMVGERRFDIAVGGITSTVQRRLAFSFSRPYFVSGKTAVVRCDSPVRSPALRARIEV